MDASIEVGDAEAAAPAAARAKRPARERKKKERFELLHSMTVDQRRQYLLDLEAHALAKVDNMQRAAAASDAQRIAVDLSFDAIMNEKEVHSLAKQLKLSYGAVKGMQQPFQLHLLNCSEALRRSLARFSSDKWLVHWHDGRGIAETTDPKNIVYLSPDSPNVLTELDATKMYVIGGIVDKSRKKGATLNAASNAGVATARLPIQEHIADRLDHILNVNTVIEVLIRFRENGGDWAAALRDALPQRKQSQIGRKARRKQAAQQTDANSHDAELEELGEHGCGGDDTDDLSVMAAAFLSSEARFGPFLDAVKQKAEPGPFTYTPPERFQAPANRNGTFGSHYDPKLDPRAVSTGVASAVGIAATAPKNPTPGPWTYSPAVGGQFPQAFTSADIQRVRDEITASRPVARQKQRCVGPLKDKEELSFAKLRLALGPGSYDVNRDVNQEVISTSCSFGRERRKGLMDHVAAAGENGCSPDLVNYQLKRESATATLSANSRHGARLASEKRRWRMAVESEGEQSSASMCSPGLGMYHAQTAVAGISSTAKSVAEAPFKTKHASGFVVRVRSESALQRQRQDVAKFSKELAESYKQLDASVQHRDLVRFMVAAGHASDSCLETEHPTSSPSPDYLALAHTSAKRVGSSDPDDALAEASQLSTEELWRAMRLGPSAAMPSSKETRARKSGDVSAVATQEVGTDKQ